MEIRGNKMIRTFFVSCATFLIASCGGGGSSNSVAPSITDPGALSVQEGSTGVTSISASDSDGDALSYSISEGDDKALFSLSTTGVLAFLTAPDFENPGDADSDNVYELTIQVSDGALIDDQKLRVSVTDAFEGRIVDAPIKGASVFVDLNNNDVQDEGEPSGVTDDNGFFNVAMFELPAGTVPKVISKGGTDILTGEELPKLVMISDIPADLTKPANVTPLTTVLASVDTVEAKTELLAAMGIVATPEYLLTNDGWEAVKTGDADAKATQRINQQIGLLLQTASTMVDGADAAAGFSVSLARSVAVEINKAAVSNMGLDLTSSAALQSVLIGALNEVATEAVIGASVLIAISESVATVNAVVADPTLDPSSELAAAIVKAAQKDLQSSVKAVVDGTVTVDAFKVDTDYTKLFTNVVLLDTDGDGIADALDTDDDGDGVIDTADAFPKDATETVDTDSDGTGNNADEDDDGDGALDYEDPFPLDGSVTGSKTIPAEIGILR
jgi:hypothetical protein